MLFNIFSSHASTLCGVSTCLKYFNQCQPVSRRHDLIIPFPHKKVIKKEEKVFIAKENKRPRMKLKKLQVPIKIEKRRKTSAKLRNRVVAKKPKLTATDIQMPEITGVLGGLGAMKGGEGLGAEVGSAADRLASA